MTEDSSESQAISSKSDSQSRTVFNGAAKLEIANGTGNGYAPYLVWTFADGHRRGVQFGSTGISLINLDDRTQDKTTRWD